VNRFLEEIREVLRWPKRDHGKTQVKRLGREGKRSSTRWEGSRTGAVWGSGALARTVLQERESI